MKRTSFTLIELLVVVAIIAVLVAVLLPAVQQARQRGLSVKCAALLKQDGTSLLMYAQDNHDFFVRYGETAAEWSRGIWYRWFYVMYRTGYLPCSPSDNSLGIPFSKSPYHLCPASGPGSLSAYAMNMGASVKGGYNSPLRKISEIPRPDQAALLCDGNGYIAYVQIWSPITEVAGTNRHLGGINIVFVDGRVDWREGIMPTRDPGVNPWALCAPHIGLNVWVEYQLEPWPSW